MGLLFHSESPVHTHIYICGSCSVSLPPYTNLRLYLNLDSDIELMLKQF